MSILFVPKADKFDKITCLPPLVLAILHKVFSSRFPGFLPVFLPDLLSDNVCAVKRRCPSKRCYGQSAMDNGQWVIGLHIFWVHSAVRQIGNLLNCLSNGVRVSNGTRQRLPCVKGAVAKRLRDCAVNCSDFAGTKANT